MMKKNLWEVIKKSYKDNFNIPELVIEYYANIEIIRKCIYGYSNSRIAFSLNENITYITDVLNSLLLFPGWEKDLDFNPIAVYNKCNDDYNAYYMSVIMISSISTDSIIRLSFNLCRKFKEIERMIDKYVK